MNSIYATFPTSWSYTVYILQISHPNWSKYASYHFERSDDCSAAIALALVSVHETKTNKQEKKKKIGTFCSDSISPTLNVECIATHRLQFPRGPNIRVRVRSSPGDHFECFFFFPSYKLYLLSGMWTMWTMAAAMCMFINTWNEIVCVFCIFACIMSQSTHFNSLLIIKRHGCYRRAVLPNNALLIRPIITIRTKLKCWLVVAGIGCCGGLARSTHVPSNRSVSKSHNVLYPVLNTGCWYIQIMVEIWIKKTDTLIQQRKGW